MFPKFKEGDRVRFTTSQYRARAAIASIGVGIVRSLRYRKNGQLLFVGWWYQVEYEIRSWGPWRDEFHEDVLEFSPLEQLATIRRPDDENRIEG
jgi:hypothetical protein